MGFTILTNEFVVKPRQDRNKVYVLEVSPPNKVREEPEVEISYCSFGIVETPVEEKP